MKRWMAVGVLALTILVSGAVGLAADWYVDDDNCPGPGSGTQADPYCKIQAAIDAAAAGDTINVAAGTYTPAGGPFATDHYGLKFDGSQGGITLRGANAGTPGYGTRVAESIIEGPNVPHGNAIYIFDGADGVIIDGFTLKAGDDIVENRADDVVIKNNIVTPSASPVTTNAPGIFACECDNLTVSYNWILDIGPSGGCGMFLGLNSWTADITNSLIEHNLIENSGGAGILFNYSSVGSNNTVEYNEIKNVGHDGIRTANSHDVNIQYNEIYGSARDGVRIVHNADHTINYNSIYSSVAYGVNNLDVGTTLDASCNWWSTNTAAGVAGEVSADVDYTPWLDSGTDTDPGPGFQGDLSVLNVDDDSPQTGATGRIQEGVDEVTASTVNVAAGTYTITQAIVVNKGVTITGDVGNPEMVLVQYAAPQSANNCFEITTNNVIVQGIKAINGENGFYLNGVTGCRVSNCIVSSCADKGIYVRNCPATSEATRVEVTGNIVSDCGNTWGAACIQTFGSPYTYIYNNEINATEDKGINIIRSGATGTADRVQVIGNIISGTKYPGIQVIGAPYTYVYDNTLTKCNYYGGDGTGDWDYASIHVQDNVNPSAAGGNVTVDSNTVSDGINGIQIWSSDCTITNNTVTDMGLTYADSKPVGVNTYWNSGIIIGGMPGESPTNVSVQGNTLTGNVVGLFVHHASNEAHFNNITGSTRYGVENVDTNQFDATNNWWGDDSGPEDTDGTNEVPPCTDDPTTEVNADGTGDKVSANVDYCPWTGAELGEASSNTVSGDGTVPADDTVTGIGSIDIDAAGDHTITTATYNNNPGGTALGNATGNYWDVHLDDDTGVNSLTIDFCPSNARTIISYWDGAAWQQCSNQVFNAATNCVEVTVTPTTQPTLDDLTGLAFGSGTAAGGGGPSRPRPEADAGEDQTVTVGRLVQLDGSASESRDTRSDWVGYDWSIAVKPTGSRAMLSNSNTVDPTFIPDVPGRYVITLVVTNHSSKSDYDDVTITALEAENVLNLSAGWHMIAIPLSLEDNTPEVVFAGIDPLRLFNYNGQCYDSCQAGTLTAICCMHGYWLCLGEPMELHFQGDSLVGEQALLLERAGWHMIGVPYPVVWGSGDSITLSKDGEVKSLADAVAAGWIEGRLWTYNVLTGEYEAIDGSSGAVLDPWTGYWLKALTSGVILHFAPSGSGITTGSACGEVVWRACTGTMGNPPPPPTLSLREILEVLTFTVSPNPIIDVHTTTFAVKGAAAYVEAIKVQIFDLAGRLVYEAEEPGASLDWHTENSDVEYLANGVYLYKLYALVNGEWVVSEVKKLAILR